LPVEKITGPLITTFEAVVGITPPTHVEPFSHLPPVVVDVIVCENKISVVIKSVIMRSDLVNVLAGDILPPRIKCFFQ
jgi:hypothetical protein